MSLGQSRVGARTCWKQQAGTKDHLLSVSKTCLELSWGFRVLCYPYEENERFKSSM